MSRGGNPSKQMAGSTRVAVAKRHVTEGTPTTTPTDRRKEGRCSGFTLLFALFHSLPSLMSSSTSGHTLLALRKVDTDSDTSSSSSSSSSDDVDDTTIDSSDCNDLHAEALASLYAAALASQSASNQPAKMTKSPGLSRRTSDRLRRAILEVRIALFRHRWSDLLSAFKALDLALKGALDAAALGFRLPILGASRTFEWARPFRTLL